MWDSESSWPGSSCGCSERMGGGGGSDSSTVKEEISVHLLKKKKKIHWVRLCVSAYWLIFLCGLHQTQISFSKMYRAAMQSGWCHVLYIQGNYKGYSGASCKSPNLNRIKCIADVIIFIILTLNACNTMKIQFHKTINALICQPFYLNLEIWEI